MKLIFLVLLFISNALLSQVKSFKISENGDTFSSFYYLFTSTKKKDSVMLKTYSIQNNSISNVSTSIISKESYSPLKSRVKISTLSSNFNLKNSLGNKVFLFDKGTKKEFYFLKNDSTWGHRTIEKTHLIWEFKKDEEFPLYKVEFGNKHFAYLAHFCGLIYKQNAKLKTQFYELNDYYQDTAINISLINARYCDTTFGYFNFGNYRFHLKNYNEIFQSIPNFIKEEQVKAYLQAPISYDELSNDWKFEVYKNQKLILRSLDLKYFSKDKYIAFNDSTFSFYNSQMQLLYFFKHRAIFHNFYKIEFLVKNEIHEENISDLLSIIPRQEHFACGTVTHYNLKIVGKKFVELIDGKMINGNTSTVNISNDSVENIDSLKFLNGTNSISWSDNGGFDNRIVVYKNGKCGLFELTIKDSTAALKQTTEQEFDNIYTIGNFIVVRKENKEDILNYYQENKNLRFLQLRNVNLSFIRYQKTNNIWGWLSSEANTYDDL